MVTHSPIPLDEGDVSSLTLIGLKVHTGSQAVFLKSLKDHTLSIQIWKNEIKIQMNTYSISSSNY